MDRGIGVLCDLERGDGCREQYGFGCWQVCWIWCVLADECLFHLERNGKYQMAGRFFGSYFGVDWLVVNRMGL